MKTSKICKIRGGDEHLPQACPPEFKIFDKDIDHPDGFEIIFALNLEDAIREYVRKNYEEDSDGEDFCLRLEIEDQRGVRGKYVIDVEMGFQVFLKNMNMP